MNFIRDKIRNIDHVIFIATSFLSLVSLVVLFGARDLEHGFRNFVMQGAMTVVGLIFLIILSNIDFSNLHPLVYVIVYLFSCALLVILLFKGESAGDNKNWLKIPIIDISIQPSEFIRASFILTFSKHLSIVKEEINRPRNVILLMLHAGGIMGLILISGDLGMTLVYLGIMAVMLYCAGFSLWYFLIAIAGIFAAFPFLWDFLAGYQKSRILTRRAMDFSRYKAERRLPEEDFSDAALAAREAIRECTPLPQTFSFLRMPRCSDF